MKTSMRLRRGDGGNGGNGITAQTIYTIREGEQGRSHNQYTKTQQNLLHLCVLVTTNSAVSVEAKGDLELDKESDWDCGEDTVPGVFFFTLRILDPESGLLLDLDAYSLRLEE
jgi:hypothetical protein